MAEAGKRYITPSGAELIVTKGGAGTLSDGQIPLQIKDAGDVTIEIFSVLVTRNTR